MLENSEDSSDTNKEIQASSSDAAKLSVHPDNNNQDLRSVETPRTSTKKSSGRFISQSTPHLKRSKTKMLSLRSKEDIELLNRQTSEQVIKSVYHLIKSKFPLNFGKKELSAKDQDDIQEFFLKKKLEFSQTLADIYNSKHATPVKRLKKGLKIEEKLEKNIEKEILLMRKRKKALKNEILKKASEKILKEKQQIRKKTKIESRKKELEDRKIQELEKEIILKNIENFYKDRILMFKECIRQDQEAKKILNYEEKLYTSTLFKEKKQKRMLELLSLKNKFENELEQLKNKFSSL